MKIKNKQGEIIEVPKGMEEVVTKAIQNGENPLEVMKSGGWIKDAINPKHKGYCTPMTKATCTPKRKTLAKTFKKHYGFHENGGVIPKAEEGWENIGENNPVINQVDTSNMGNYSQSYNSGLGSTVNPDGTISVSQGLPSNYGMNSPSIDPQSPPNNYDYSNPPSMGEMDAIPKPKKLNPNILTGNPYINRVQSGLSTIDKGIKQGGDEGDALIALGAVKTGLSGSAGIANEIGAWRTNKNVAAQESNNFINLFKDDYTYKPTFKGNDEQYAKYGKSIMSAESGMNIPSKFRGDRHYENSQGGIPIDVNIHTNEANNMQVPIDQANLLVEGGEYYLPKMENGGDAPARVLSDRKNVGVKINGKKLSPTEHLDHLSKETLGFTPDQMTKAIVKADKFALKNGKYLTDNSAQNTKNAINLLEETYTPIIQELSNQAFMQQEITKAKKGLPSELSQAKLGKAVYGEYMETRPISLDLPQESLANVSVTTNELPTNLKRRSTFVAPKYKTKEGIVTPRDRDLNAAPPTDYESRAKMLEGLRGSQFKDFQDFQGYDYDLALQSPEGQKAINDMYLYYGLTNTHEKEFPDIAKKIINQENLTYDEMVKLRKNYVDNNPGKRILNYDPSSQFFTKGSQNTVIPTSKTVESDKFTIPTIPVGTIQESVESDYGYPLPVALNTYPRDPVQLLQQTPHDYVPKNLTPQMVRRPYRGVTSVDRSIAGQDFLNDTLANQQATQQANNVNIAARNEADRFNLTNRQNIDTGNLNRKQDYMDAIAKREAIIQQQMNLDRNQVLSAQVDMNHEKATRDYLASVYDPRYAFNSTYTPILKQDEKKKEKKKYGGKINIKKKK